jgi:glycerol-1-phosphate dehydrogenase [NAD(P)+]
LGVRGKNGKGKVDDFAVMIAKKSVNSFVRTEFKSIREDFFIKELVDSLTMSGIAVEIAQTSALQVEVNTLFLMLWIRFLMFPSFTGFRSEWLLT